jgi:hypothetical protein
MRKGYTLIEIICLTAFLSLVLMLMNEPVRFMISDIPRQYREFQTAASLNHLLDRLKTDIEAAKEIQTTTDPNILILFGSNKTITYHFDNEQVYRITGDDPNTNNIWSLPDTNLIWEVKNQNALQITGWLNGTVIGQTKKKFHNSHLFYVKGFHTGEAR